MQAAIALDLQSHLWILPLLLVTIVLTSIVRAALA